MPKIYADELEAASSSSTQATLDANIENANSINGTIDSFINNSSQYLKGEAWDAVRVKMQEYSKAFKEQVRVANLLGEAIEKALNMLKEYMGGYDYLDSSQLPELEARKKQIEASINALRSSLETIEYYEVEKEDGTKETKSRKVFHQNVKDQLDVAVANLETITDKIKKIHAMEEAYKEAEKILEAAYAEVMAFRNSASAIVPSSMVTYNASV